MSAPAPEPPAPPGPAERALHALRGLRRVLRRRSVRHLPKSAFKFAGFAIACLVLLTALAARLGNITLFAHRYTLYAQLSDVTGLTTGSQVDVAGVEVGQVAGIGVQRTHALVTMSVNDTLVLHQGTDIGLRWYNVLGQKQVYLYPDDHGRVLRAGTTIPLSHDVSDASVDAFLNALGPFLSSINVHQANEFVENVSGALAGDTAQIDQLIDSGAAISSSVGALDTQVGRVIDSLDQVLTAIASRSGDITSLVTNLQTVAQSLSSRNQLLDDVVDNLSQVAGDLATLVGQNHTTITGIVDNLDTVTADIVAHQQQLAASLSTLGSGLAPYAEISSYGQWFQVQTVYSCLAGETTCSYYEPTAPPSGSGLGGGPPDTLPAGASPPAAPSAASGAVPTAGFPAVAQSSVPTVLQVVGGR